MAYEPIHLKLWTMPDHYMGAVYPATYSAGVGQSRDSSALERTNFKTMLDLLGGESETVRVIRESHWAVGWVEWIALDQDDDTALEIADQAMGRLKEYPSLDDDAWSELEYEEAADYWDGLSPREKVQTAMEERKRYHWLQATPVWPFGRLSFYELGNRDCPIANAIHEHLRMSS